jgi:predicted DsbA family dithiol-disulfide isomerase
MAENPRQSSSLFTHIDVSTHSSAERRAPESRRSQEVTDILQQIVAAQDRQNELMEELIEQMGTAQRQRSAELSQWKQANPRLARRCREAAETLGKVQSAFLEAVAVEINDNAEHLMEGDFMLNEFVDRFGPRLAHLNGVLQVLSQLSANGQEA